VITQRASVPWKYGSGFHSFRRNVVTLLDSMGNQSDISIYKFIRWATPRHLGMLDRYRRTPSEESDARILGNHPRVKLWEEVISYLFQYNPYYRKLSNIDILSITAFVASGFEHSGANMYFAPMGLALKGQLDVLATAQDMAGQSIMLGNLTVAGFLVKNLIPVTLGNIIGGSLLVGGI
jgi:hypothetical protein